MLLPSHPPLFIGCGERGLRPRVPLGGWRQPPDPIWGRGRRPGRWLAPQVRWRRPHPLGFTAPMRMGWGGRRTSPPRGWFPSTCGPCSPLGPVAPPGGPPEPFRWSRYVTGVARNNSGDQNLTSYIYESLPPDHSGAPRDVRDLIRDSEQPSVTTYIISL